jgi:hypothetical protein
MSDQTFEELISEKFSQLSEFIDETVGKHPEYDPLNNRLKDLSQFEAIKEFGNFSTHRKKELLVELACSKVLANLINLRDASNDYNYKHIALVVEMGFYLKQIGLARFDLPYLLTQIAINELPVDWLLRFWSFFEYRIHEYRDIRPGEALAPTRSAGVTMIITLNLKLRELRRNNEPRRDLLKDKVLYLTSQIFPLFDRCFINKKFEHNMDSKNEHPIPKGDKGLFYSFWDLQEFFQDPISFVKSFNHTDSLKGQIFSVIEHLRRIEHKKCGPLPGSQAFRQRSVTDTDNTLERYERQDLSESQRVQLLALANRDFSPLFFIDKEKFYEQLEGDASLRKIVWIQLYIVSGYLNYILQGRFTRSSVNSKIDKFQEQYGKRGQLIFLKDVQQDTRRILQHCYPGLMRCLRIYDIIGLYHVNQRLQNYKTFDTYFEELALDDEFWDSMKKRTTIKQRYWAKYGTSEISKHWLINTGLELLEKEDSKGSVAGIGKELESLRDEDKDNELHTWKALRLAKNVHLFKFNQVNDAIGFEGLFDPDLKKEFDDKVAKLDEEKEALYQKLELEDQEREKDSSDVKKQIETRKLEEESKRKELEFLRREEELKREIIRKNRENSSDQEDLINKKRKASQELTDVNAKKSKTEIQGTSSAGSILDDLPY